MTELHQAYLMAGAAALCWGFVVIFPKLTDVPGHLGIPIAMATGAITMFLLAGDDIQLLARLSYGELGMFALTGTLQFTVGSTLYYEAIRRGDVSVTVPITRLKVLPILFLSIAAGLETFSWPLLGACLLVVAGGMLLGAPHPKAEPAARYRHWVSVALAIGVCMCWAVGETLIGTLPKHIPAVATNFMLLSCGLVTYVIYAVASGAWRDVLNMPGRGIWCYMGHGLVSFALAYTLFVRAIQIAGPPRTVCITSAYPLIAALVGWIVFKERFAKTLAAGALLLATGVALLQFV